MEEIYKRDNVIMFKTRGIDMLATKKYLTKTQTPTLCVMDNVSTLYAKDWKQTDKKGKSVYNVSTTGKATVSTLELIADKSKIPAWYLLLPLTPELLSSDELEILVMGYISSSPETRGSLQHLLKTLNPD